MIIKIPFREKTNDIKRNLETVLTELEESKDIDFLFFNEGFLQGNESLSFKYKDDVEVSRFQNGAEIASIKDALKGKKISIGLGYYENYKGGLYNSFIVLGKNGNNILNYRTNSKNWKPIDACADYREGEKLFSFRVKDSEVGVVSYFDLLDEANLSKLVNMDGEVDLFLCMGILSKEEFEDRESEFFKISEIFDKPILLYLRDKTDGLVLILKHGKVIKEDKLKIGEDYIFTM